MKKIGLHPTAFRKTKIVTAVLLVAAVWMFAPVASAQSRWSAALRPGINLPLKKLGDANLETGFGFEATLAYRFLPHLSAYTGWGWSRFSADRSFAGSKTDFEETGYRFGLQLMHPFEQSKINYVFTGGAVYNHIEAENDVGDLIADSGHGWGWQAGAGVVVPVGNRFRMIPGVRFQSLSRTFTTNGRKTGVELNYLALQVGLAWSF